MSTLFNAFEIPEQTIQSDSGASYTIPENYYGIVQAQSAYGSSFKVNGVSVLYGANVTRTGQSMTGSSSGTVTVLTATEPCMVSVSIVRGGTNNSAATSAVYANIGGVGTTIFSQNGTIAIEENINGIVMAPGDLIQMNKNAQFFSFYVGVSAIPVNGYESRTFRVKAGDVISGGRYHLELYRIPGTA